MFIWKRTAILENKTTAKVELNNVLTFFGAGWNVMGNDSGIDSTSSIDEKMNLID